MSTEISSREVSWSRPATPALSLRTGALLRTVMLICFLLFEVQVWVKLRNGFPFWSPSRRLMAWLYFSPGMAYRAFAIAAASAVAGDLVFRFGIRPLMAAWYECRSRDRTYVLPLTFSLKPGERIEAEVGARRVGLARRSAGRLVRTNQAVYFFPFAWDEEPWSLPIGRIAETAKRTPRRRVLNLIAGYPDQLILTDHQGVATAFVVADPAQVLRWFEPYPSSSAEVG